MMTFYARSGQSLAIIDPAAIHNTPDDIVWIDLLNITNEEELFVESLFGIDIPTQEEMDHIDLSSRLYTEDGAVFTTATLITNADSPETEMNSVTFILVRNCLITLRYADPKSFRSFIHRIGKIVPDDFYGNRMLTLLLEAIVARLAEILDKIGHSLDDTAKALFAKNSLTIDKEKEREYDLEETMRRIGTNGDLISKTRESLFSLGRLVSYAAQTSYFRPNSEELIRLQTLQRDIPALSDHASFLSSKTTFLLDATLGMLSIEQNGIIKIFSVAAVIFLPPTLVASIYGMNFHFMPELDWQYGYPLAILFMILSAIIPYTFFRSKGWL